MMDLFRASSVPPKRVAEIREWAEELFRTPVDARVMITELRCTEPGCSPLETVIAIFGPGGSRQYKIHKPMTDIVFADVAALVHAR